MRALALVVLLSVTVQAQGIVPALTPVELARFQGEWPTELAKCEFRSRKADVVELRCATLSPGRAMYVTVDVTNGLVLGVESARSRFRGWIVAALGAIATAAVAVLVND